MEYVLFIYHSFTFWHFKQNQDINVANQDINVAKSR